MLNVWSSWIALIVACCLMGFSVQADQLAPIRIGVISSLDPVGATWSSSANIGFEKAQEEINNSGGINGRRLELIFEDDRFDPKKAISAYRKLVNVDRVDLLIGPQFEQTLTPVIPLATRDNRLLITTVATTPLSQVKTPWVIHSFPPDKLGARCLADAIVQDRRSRLMLLIPEESFSQTFASFVRDSLRGVPYESVNYNPEESDFNSILLKAKKYRPDSIVFFFVTAQSAVAAFQKMGQLDMQLPVYSNEVLHDSVEFLSAAGEMAAGTTYCIVPYDLAGPKLANFLTGLPDRPVLPLYSLVAYDTLNWLGEILRKHGTDNEKLKAAIYSLSYDGLFTTYRFDEYGDLSYSDFAPFEVRKSGFSRKMR